MVGHMNADLAKQVCAQRVRSAEEDRLGRRLARRRKAARRLERQATRPHPMVQPA